MLGPSKATWSGKMRGPIPETVARAAQQSERARLDALTIAR
jgi:hypothetical protein